MRHSVRAQVCSGNDYANTFPANPFIGSPLVRTDAFINFNWNSSSPDPSIPNVNYTVRWVGMVQPLFNETYTFYTTRMMACGCG